MAAIPLNGRRDTPSFGSGLSPLRINSLPVTPTKQCKPGGMAILVVATATVEPGKTAAAGLVVALGRFNALADNTGSITPQPIADIETGVFPWGNSGGGDTISAANIGATCYIVDDQTVALTSNSGARCAAGIVVGMTADGQVMVAMSPILQPLVA